MLGLGWLWTPDKTHTPSVLSSRPGRLSVWGGEAQAGTVAWDEGAPGMSEVCSPGVGGTWARGVFGLCCPLSRAPGSGQPSLWARGDFLERWGHLGSLAVCGGGAWQTTKDPALPRAAPSQVLLWAHQLAAHCAERWLNEGRAGPPSWMTGWDSGPGLPAPIPVTVHLGSEASQTWDPALGLMCHLVGGMIRLRGLSRGVAARGPRMTPGRGTTISSSSSGHLGVFPSSGLLTPASGGEWQAFGWARAEPGCKSAPRP
uniref:Uncharacterized protein n=1 Tax=Molossus molossus TaxID=27622 RepID=A0A7J8EE96_MOLMO|nr:hypothetical protein HJG59_008800 [Molossus molossus]